MEQEPRQQGRKPAAARKVATSGGIPAHPIAPKCLKFLSGESREERQDEEHLAEGELVRSLALTI